MGDDLTGDRATSTTGIGQHGPPQSFAQAYEPLRIIHSRTGEDHARPTVTQYGDRCKICLATWRLLCNRRLTTRQTRCSAHQWLTKLQIHVHGATRQVHARHEHLLRDPPPRRTRRHLLRFDVAKCANVITVETHLIHGLRRADPLQFGWPVGGTHQHRDTCLGGLGNCGKELCGSST